MNAYEGSISAQQVAEIFGVGLDTLSLWRRKGVLSGIPTESKRVNYHPDTINAFLKKSMRGKKRQDITVEQLLTKEVELVSIEQASELTEFEVSDFYHHLTGKRRVSFVKLGPRLIRLIKEEVLQLTKTDCVTFEVGERVTGVAQSTLTALAISDKLQTERVGSKNQIVRASLINLLTELLPDWIDAEAWFAEMVNAPRAVYTFMEVVEQFGEERTRTLMRKRKLRFIASPSKRHRFVSPVSVMNVVMQDDTVAPEMLAKLFDASVEDVERWIASGLLACDRHVHTDRTLYKTCVIGILQRHLSKRTPAIMWYDTRQQSSESLLTEEEAALFLQVSVEHIAQLSRDNKLRGVRTPDDVWKFTQYQLKEYRRRN